jgi:CheY-like chemotaxis protein
MTCLLMLDADSRLVSVVSRTLQQEGVTVLGASNVAQALEALARQRFDCALIDCDGLEPDELAMFTALPLILTTSYLEPEGAQRFCSQAPRLRKPFTNAQLSSLLRETCMASWPESHSLVDVLRRAHSAGQTLSLRVGGARVFVENGELVHAEHGAVLGEPALAEALAQSHERAVSVPPYQGLRTIHRPFQALMLDLLRHLDEREQSAPGGRLPDNVTRLHKGPGA